MPIIFITGHGDNDLITIYEIGGFVEYSFPMDGAWVPFVGAGGFYVGAEADDDYYDKDGADADTAVGKVAPAAGLERLCR